jgi:hypothetical protein
MAAMARLGQNQSVVKAGQKQRSFKRAASCVAAAGWAQLWFDWIYVFC